MDKIKENKKISVQEQRTKAEIFADQLFCMASERFGEVATEIQNSIQNVVNGSHIYPVIASVGDERAHYHRYQIVETAKELGYFANLRNYHSWIQLDSTTFSPEKIEGNLSQDAPASFHRTARAIYH